MTTMIMTCLCAAACFAIGLDGFIKGIVRKSIFMCVCCALIIALGLAVVNAAPTLI